jgi:hypothetical protein
VEDPPSAPLMTRQLPTSEHKKRENGAKDARKVVTVSRETVEDALCKATSCTFIEVPLCNSKRSFRTTGSNKSICFKALSNIVFSFSVLALAIVQGPSNLKEMAKESPFGAAGDFLHSH